MQRGSRRKGVCEVAENWGKVREISAWKGVHGARVFCRVCPLQWRQTPVFLGKNIIRELGVRRSGCIRGVRQQHGRDPSNIWSSKSLVFKRCFGEGTHWDFFLLVSLTHWDMPVLFTPYWLTFPERHRMFRPSGCISRPPSHSDPHPPRISKFVVLPVLVLENSGKGPQTTKFSKSSPP